MDNKGIRTLYFPIFGILVLFLLFTLWIGERNTRPSFPPIPFLYQDRAWSDSLALQLDHEAKANQWVMIKLVPGLNEDSLLKQIRKIQPGGVWFSGFSYSAQTRLLRKIRAFSEIPLLIGVDAPDGGLGFPDPIEVASLPNNEAIQTFARGMALEAKMLDANLIFTPSLNCSIYSEPLTQKVLAAYEPLSQQRIISCMELDCPDPDALVNRDTSSQYFEILSTGGLTAIKLLGREEESFSKRLRSIRSIFQGLILVEVSDSLIQNEDLIGGWILNGADLLICNSSELATSLQSLVTSGQLSHQGLSTRVQRQLMAKGWALRPGPLKADSLRLSVNYRKFRQQSLILARDDSAQIPFSKLSDQRLMVLSIGEPAAPFLEMLANYAPIEHIRLEKSRRGRWRVPPASQLREFNPLVLVANGTTGIDSVLGNYIHDLSQRFPLVGVHFGPPNELNHLDNASALLQVYHADAYSQELAAQSLYGGRATYGVLPYTVSERLRQGQGIMTRQQRMGFSLPEEINMSSRHMSLIDSIVEEGIRRRAMPGCQVLVARNKQVIFHKAYGHHTYRRRRRVRTSDLYDIASVTKAGATTLAAMLMIDEGKLKLEDELGDYFKNTEIILDSAERGEISYYQDTLPWKEAMDSLSAWQNETGEVEKFSEEENEEMQALALSFWPPDSLLDFGWYKAKRIEDSVIVVFRPEALVLSRESNIFNVKIQDLLTHHSGLQAAMPILPYLTYQDSGYGRYERYFQPEQNDTFSIEVARDFYLRYDYRDSIWDALKHLGRYRKKRYKYSDVNFVLLQQAIDSINEYSIKEYLEERIYQPLGLSTLRFQPLLSMEETRIIPSSHDVRWRGQLLRGYVHDPSAALFGGVLGNAGLFSNAFDLGVVFQMLLDRGIYGGDTLIQPETVELFTSLQEGHRGLGFDKLPSDGRYIVSSMSSPDSYGHTGFTGTCVWVDPNYDLVYIFLSNRAYPSAKNWRINSLAIRRRVHDVIYNSIGAGLE